jgi:drug/metabolite transporter (DMT)-like permease
LSAATFPQLGMICALVAPLCWAVGVTLFRQSSAGRPIALNLFKNMLALGLLTLTMIATGTRVPLERDAGDWVRLAVSGVVGLAVADTFLFAALARLGAARLAIIDLVYAPTVVLLSWAFLGEHMRPAYFVGAAVVLVGVAIASVDRDALDREHWRSSPASGYLYGLGAIVGTALGVVLAKPVLERSDLIEVTWTRLLAGVAAQAIGLTVARAWGAVVPVFRPSPLWRTLVPATVVGTYFSLLFWLGGFKWGTASVAAVLNQMATVYILVLARVVLHEAIPVRRLVGAGIAIAGAVAIVLTR